jgi:hypothetical protein
MVFINTLLTLLLCGSILFGQQNRDSLLDLDKIINKGPVNSYHYFASLKNDVLEIVDMDIELENPFGNLGEKNLLKEYPFLNVSNETYTIEKNRKGTVKKYSFNKSFIKTYYNDHPSVKNLDLVCGTITDTIFILYTGIRIGMTKKTFFKTFFKLTRYINDINKVIVYCDGQGDQWATYIFAGNKLKEISFNSCYTWIKKD